MLQSSLRSGSDCVKYLKEDGKPFIKQENIKNESAFSLFTYDWDINSGNKKGELEKSDNIDIESDKQQSNNIDIETDQQQTTFKTEVKKESEFPLVKCNWYVATKKEEMVEYDKTETGTPESNKEEICIQPMIVEQNFNESHDLQLRITDVRSLQDQDNSSNFHSHIDISDQHSSKNPSLVTRINPSFLGELQTNPGMYFIVTLFASFYLASCP